VADRAQPRRRDVQRIQGVGREEQRHRDGLPDAHEPFPLEHQTGDRHRQAGEERRGEDDCDHDSQHAQRIPVHADAEQGGDHHHDDGLRDRADARCECLAGHERRPRGGRDEQLGEDAGVAFPDDLDAVEDRDEQGRLRDDARCQEVQVRDRTCRYGADLAERLAEYDEPEDWLDGAGEQFTTVVPQPLQFDQAERADARDEQPHAPYRPAVSPRRGPFDE